MRNSILLAGLGSAMLGIGAISQPSEASVVYREVFGRASTPSAALDLSVADWAIVRQAGAPGAGGISNAVGRPTDLYAVNATTDNPDEGTNIPDIGFVNARWNDPGITDTFLYLYHTTEYTLARPTPAGDADTAFSLHLGLSDADEAYRPRLAVQVGGQWYVSDARLVGGNVPNEASFDDNAAEVSLALADAGGFRTLDITDQSGAQATLTVGATPAALPAGDITGFGLLAYQASGVRLTFDTFTVTVVPEPAIGLGLVGLGCMLRMRRRGSDAS